MPETIDKNAPTTTPEKEEPLSQEEKDLLALQAQLSQAAEGWSIEVRRVEPYWCAGLLCTIPIIDPDRPVDFDGLVKQWGGQTLRLKLKNQKGQYKGGGTLVARSWPPKVNGKVITEQDILHPPGVDPERVPPTLNPANMLATMQQSNPNPYGINIPELMKMAMSAKGGDNGQMAARLLEHALTMQQQAVQQAAQQPRIDIMGQMEGFMGMFKMFQEMKGLFGDGGGGGGGDDSIMPMLNMLMQGFSGSGGPPQQRPPRRRGPIVTGPTGAPPPPKLAQSPPPAPLPQAGPQVAQTQQSVNPQPQAPAPNHPVSLESLARQLSGLSPRDAAEVSLMAFGDMPEQSRAEALQHFLGDADQYLTDSETPELDDSSYLEDNYDNDVASAQEQHLPGASPQDKGRI